MSTYNLVTSAICVFACFLLQTEGCGQASARSFKLTDNGKSVATIVLAHDGTHVAQFAASELQFHIRKMTGAILPIVNDRTPVRGNRILVGESDATRKMGLSGQTFKPQEYLIRCSKDTLVLMGRDKKEPPPSIACIHGNPQWVTGKFGKALRFDGASAVGVTDCGFNDDAGTMELWAWLPEQSSLHEATLLRLDGANPWTYHIIRRMGRQVVYVTYDGQAGTAVSSKDLPEGWRHILATHDVRRGVIELFIDGVSCGTAPFTRTTCKGATLHIGGIAPPQQGGKVGNPFTGVIDEVRISRAVLTPATSSLSGAVASDADATLLLHFDEGSGTPSDASGALRAISPPGVFDDQGTCYAVYDFLERFCGVRWFAPTELGMVCPQTKTLEVRVVDVRRSPFFKFRQGEYMPVYGILKAVWNNPTPQEVRLYARRMRLGGQPYAANHSFYGYYDRYWKKDSPQFEAERPDWFAKGYSGQPPQMCYTNQGFINQVIQDARDYFDGKGAKPGAQAYGDYFALVPMDNSSWCKCPECQAELDPSEKANPHFSNGWASDYIFGFANKVAREIRKTHPKKYLATLAYSSYAYYPKRTRLESNIAVQLCLHVRNWWAPSMEENDMKFYRSWTTKEKERPIYLWLYYTFPEEVAMFGKWHCFPGFFAHTLDRQWKMFAKDGIRGAFLNNLGDYLDTYLTFRLMDAPFQNVEKMIDEFHRLYYGAAAEPMKQMYLRIENIFMTPQNYPEDIRTGKMHSHQTEEMAWGYLGTEQRMNELRGLMQQAKSLASTDVEKQRVALFERGVWDYMVEGRRRWVARQALMPEIQELKSQPPPLVHVPRVEPAGGDAGKVDWLKALVLDNWRMVDGYPTERKLEARVAHDAKFLYIQCQDIVDTATLVSDDHIWAADDWEIFFALNRKPPYRQVGVNPKGRYEDVVYGEGATWEQSGVKIVSDTSSSDRWIAWFVFPLARLLPGGLGSGSTFYANLYRATKDRSYFAWSPNFRASFHELSRLGEFVLE